MSMRRFTSFFFLALPMAMMAQIQFGYLSYDTVLHEMPAYARAMADLQELRIKYEAEAIRGEEEFQKKFVDFLQGQKEFPPTIMQKRQVELQSLMDNGITFRQQVQKLLAQAEEDMLGGVKKELNRAILEIGVEYGYGYILNLDGNSCPYINPVVGVDVTDLVRCKLGLIEMTMPTPDTGDGDMTQPADSVLTQPQPAETLESDVTTH